MHASTYHAPATHASACMLLSHQLRRHILMPHTLLLHIFVPGMVFRMPLSYVHPLRMLLLSMLLFHASACHDYCQVLVRRILLQRMFRVGLILPIFVTLLRVVCISYLSL